MRCAATSVVASLCVMLDNGSINAGRKPHAATRNLCGMQKALHLLHDTEQAVFTFKRTQRWRDAAKVRSGLQLMLPSEFSTSLHAC